LIIRPAFVSNINRESPRFPIPHFPALPCSQTPPMSPAASPLTAAYCCLPDTRPCRPSVLDFTGLNRFTCVTAGRSLPLRLRLADGVTAYQPKGRFPVGGWPLPGQEFHLPEASSFAWRPLCTSRLQRRSRTASITAYASSRTLTMGSVLLLSLEPSKGTPSIPVRPTARPPRASILATNCLFSNPARQ